MLPNTESLYVEQLPLLSDVNIVSALQVATMKPVAYEYLHGMPLFLFHSVGRTSGSSLVPWPHIGSS